jgi:hypothetical protein
MLLRWSESYISNREQQVIIKDTITLKGNLKVGVLQAQSLVLYCFLYLLMTLPMIWLDCVDCLLMTRPLAKDHLKLIICVLWLTLIYKYFTHWAKLWLTKLIPEKRETVYFSTRPYLLDLYFSIDNVKFKTSDAHKLLGIDCKWSKHINNVVVKQANNYNLRNANNFTIPRCRLTLFQDSVFQPLFISGIIYPNISEIYLVTAFQNLN